MKTLLFCVLTIGLSAQSLTTIQSANGTAACTSPPTSLLCIGGGAVFNGQIQITTPNVEFGGSIYLPVPLIVTVNAGAYSFQLVPTDSATPVGSAYSFRYVPTCGTNAPRNCAPWVETVLVPSSGSPITFAQLTRQTSAAPFAPFITRGFYQPFYTGVLAGMTAYLWLPYGCVIRGWSLTVDPGGSAAVDVWKTALGSDRPVSGNSITGGNYPSVSGATVPIRGTNLTSWSTSAAANDNWAVHVVSVSNTSFLGFGIECD